MATKDGSDAGVTGLPRRVATALTALTALAALVLIGLPAPASAHATLVGSTPTQGQHLDALPDEVSFEFNQDMASPAYVIVTAPDGSSVADGPPQVDGAVVRQAVTDGPEGSYTMAYRAVSEDGHPVTGEITFSIGAAGTAAPSASTGRPTSPSSTATSTPDPAAAADGDGPGRRVGLLVGLGIFAAAGLLLLLSRRAGP